MSEPQNPAPAAVKFSDVLKQSTAKAFPWLLMFGIGIAYLQFHVLPHLGGGAGPAGVDAAKLAKAYAPEVIDTLGDAWVAAGAKVAGGGTMAEAQAALQQSWDAARQAAFARDVTPSFAGVAPEGADLTAANRPAVAKLFNDFGQALKKASGKK